MNQDQTHPKPADRLIAAGGAKKDDGGPAFPGLHPSKDCRYQDGGMTLRDWFAGQALIGHMEEKGVWYASDIAEECYRIADEMLKARAQ